MRTHEQLVKKLMHRPGVRLEIERIEREESTLLDALLKARTQARLNPLQLQDTVTIHLCPGRGFQ